MEQKLFETIIDGIHDGSVVPCLGPQVLSECRDLKNGEPMPADSDSLIIAMNGGRPMAPKLMYEFPRAAMNIELKRGRVAVNRFLEHTYSKREWSRAPIHDWLATIKPPYVIDINRDTQLQESYAETPHTLITGCSRISGTDYRFRLHHYDGEGYRDVSQEEVDTTLPILFKPMGTPLPVNEFIASDADYVDYITELMGGFAIPDFLKQYRKDKQYVFIGMPLTRDTERMVMGDIIYAAAEPAGWAFIANPTKGERRFARRMGITIIEEPFTLPGDESDAA